MQRFILARFAQSFLTLWALSFVVFISAHLTGDPVMALLPLELADEEGIQRLKERFGLDKSKTEQYLIFMKNAVQLDFGQSVPEYRPALEVLAERIPATLQLTVAGMGLAIILGVPLGMLAAVRPNSVFDYLSKLYAVIGMAAPQFWVAIMAVLFFGAYLKVLPTFGRGGPDHYILPAFVLVVAHHGGDDAPDPIQYAGNPGQRVHQVHQGQGFAGKPDPLEARPEKRHDSSADLQRDQPGGVAERLRNCGGGLCLARGRVACCWTR